MELEPSLGLFIYTLLTILGIGGLFILFYRLMKSRLRYIQLILLFLAILCAGIGIKLEANIGYAIAFSTCVLGLVLIEIAIYNKGE